mmetsp:Transcript_35499/g.92497  ORF Transcript_35499/g.92497 Transcript_35499/m.92497 type:complete len:309 (-) Transcript_35499:1377-2303(-)
MSLEPQPLSLKKVFGPKAVPEAAIQILKNRVSYLERTEKKRRTKLDETKALIDAAKQSATEANEADSVTRSNEEAINTFIEQQKQKIRATREERQARVRSLQASLSSTARQLAMTSTSARDETEATIHRTAREVEEQLSRSLRMRAEAQKERVHASANKERVRKEAAANAQREEERMHAKVIDEIKNADLERVRQKKEAVKEELRKADERKKANRRKVEKAHHEANLRRKQEETARLQELQSKVKKLQNEQYLLLDGLKTTSQLHERASKDLEKTLRSSMTDTKAEEGGNGKKGAAAGAALQLPGARY